MTSQIATQSTAPLGTAPDRWFVHVTRVGHERLAKMQYEDFEKQRAVERPDLPPISVFLPLRERAPTKDEPIVEVLWSGYLFVTIPYIPERVIAAIRLVSVERKPIMVPEGVIERWMSHADSDGLLWDHDGRTYRYVPPAEREYAPGDLVRGLYGNVAGYFGIFRKQFGIEAKIEITCEWGRKVVTVRLGQIAPVEIGEVQPAGEARRMVI